MGKGLKIHKVGYCKFCKEEVFSDQDYNTRKGYGLFHKDCELKVFGNSLTEDIK